MVQPDQELDLRDAVELSGRGVIYSYTVIQDAPAGYEDQSPYALALVKLDDGPIVTAQITDLRGQLQIGEPVEMVTRKLTAEGKKGMIVYGYKFRPLLNS